MEITALAELDMRARIKKRRRREKGAGRRAGARLSSELRVAGRPGTGQMPHAARLVTRVCGRVSALRHLSFDQVP